MQSDNPIKTKDKIISFIPLLNDINIDLKFKAHNMHKKKEMGIINLNNDSISALNKNQIDSINSSLKKHQDLIEFFNYSLI